MSELYIGLMSGTSLDGIDAGLVDFSENQCRVIGFHYEPFEQNLKKKLRQLSQPDQPILLTDYGSLDSQLGQLFAESVKQLLTESGISHHKITAIGSHGLTIYHAPQHEFPFSLQIGDPNIIAEITGITTVADFRRRDIAAQGQGAPMVPAFHQHFFAKHGKNLCVINIGGIANVTIINDETVLGFDTGPGNTLMDYWINKNRGQNYDTNGDWARLGEVNHNLLAELKNDPYFHLPPPKSTGKEYFSSFWLEDKLSSFADLPNEDVQATLSQLTADTVTDGIKQYAENNQITLVCGGGCHNHFLFNLIRQNLPHPISSTLDFGIDPDHVEAIAFAWLARQTLHNRPGNLYLATGAKAPVVLGGIYPGKQGLKLCGKG